MGLSPYHIMPQNERQIREALDQKDPKAVNLQGLRVSVSRSFFPQFARSFAK